MIIRRTPGDFVVEERLTPQASGAIRAAPSREAPFAVYRLDKTSLTTPDATLRLAKALGVRASAIEHAGMKDKHARTVQHVTVQTENAAAAARLVNEASGPNWSVARLGWSREAAHAGWIGRNRFTIVVRDGTPEAFGEMDRRVRILSYDSEREAPRSPPPLPAGEVAESSRPEGEKAPAPARADRVLFVNYFGDQRFGSARHGRGFAGRHLIRGDFEGAIQLLIATPARKDHGVRREFTRRAIAKWGDWPALAAELPRCPDRRAIEVLARGGSYAEAFAALPYLTQQLAVEAYQSLLWNATARAFVEETFARERANEAPTWTPDAASADALLRADDPYGVMLFPPARCVDDATRAIELPMLAASTTLREPWAKAAERVLREEGVALADLRVPGLRRPAFQEFGRPLFVAAESFTMSTIEADEMSNGGTRWKRTLVFELPRGAYATVVLRALGQ